MGGTHLYYYSMDCVLCDVEQEARASLVGILPATNMLHGRMAFVIFKLECQQTGRTGLLDNNSC